MHVECSACHARYVISDERIPIQGARVRCRKCQAVFSIERSAAGANPPTPADLPLIPPTPQVANPAPPVSAPGESSLFGPSAAPAEPSPFGGPPPPAPAEPSPYAAPPASSRFDSSPFETAPAAPAPPAPSRFDSSPFESAPATPPQSGAQPHAAPTEIERFATAFASSPPAVAEPQAAARAPMPPPASEAEAATSAPQSPAPVAPAAPPLPVAASPFSPSAGIPPGLPEAERLKHERARRLARVLASDIAIYNREKRERGIQEGNLVAVLGYEIKKSWEVYKERVTPQLANATPYFRDALNDMLAQGKKVF